MGRRKIEIVEIKDPRRRKSTFQKRKGGILKKAQELAILTGSKITLKIDNDIVASSHIFHAEGIETLLLEPSSPSDILSTELVPLSHPPPPPPSEPGLAELVPWVPDISTIGSSSPAIEIDSTFDWGLTPIDNTFDWGLTPLDPCFMPTIDDIMQYLPDHGQQLALDTPELSEIEPIALLLPSIDP